MAVDSHNNMQVKHDTLLTVRAAKSYLRLEPLPLGGL